MYGFKEIYLEKDEIAKVSKFFEEEFGITIATIQADGNHFVIRAIDDSWKTEKSVKAFKDFCERYNKGEEDGTN